MCPEADDLSIEFNLIEGGDKGNASTGTQLPDVKTGIRERRQFIPSDSSTPAPIIAAASRAAPPAWYMGDTPAFGVARGEPLTVKPQGADEQAYADLLQSLALQPDPLPTGFELVPPSTRPLRAEESAEPSATHESPPSKAPPEAPSGPTGPTASAFFKDEELRLLDPPSPTPDDALTEPSARLSAPTEDKDTDPNIRPPESPAPEAPVAAASPLTRLVPAPPLSVQSPDWSWQRFLMNVGVVILANAFVIALYWVIHHL